MSQMELLLPTQKQLSVCEISPDLDASVVSRAAETSVGEQTNYDDKHVPNGPTPAKVKKYDSTVDLALSLSPNKIKKSDICDPAEIENVCPSTNKNVGQQPRKKRNNHRRGKKRKWKPYDKLTWEQRREIEEKEEKRALKLRAEMSADGIALAPYNTTQFLMDDLKEREHDDHDRISDVFPRRRDNSYSNDSSEGLYSSPEDEEDFIEQQYTETYKDFHRERLSDLSKGDLVQELMALEDRIEELQRKLEGFETDHQDGGPFCRYIFPNVCYADSTDTLECQEQGISYLSDDDRNTDFVEDHRTEHCDSAPMTDDHHITESHPELKEEIPHQNGDHSVDYRIELCEGAVPEDHASDHHDGHIIDDHESHITDVHDEPQQSKDYRTEHDTSDQEDDMDNHKEGQHETTCEVTHEREDNCVEDYRIDHHEHHMTDDDEDHIPENAAFEEQLEKIRVFEEEINKLTRENETLRIENQDLRRQLQCVVNS